MANTTAIEWTDTTWNPITGCTKVSPGCDHCYAEALAERFHGTPGHYFERGFDLQLRPGKLEDPLRWRKPRRVFVNSMSDLFHADITDEYIVQVWAVMALAPRHTFQVLTKRHSRMRSLLSSDDFYEAVAREASKRISAMQLTEAAEDRLFGDADWTVDVLHHDEDLWEPPWPLPNVWLGVSAEDQKRADLRIPALLETPAAIRFLSCEPLLGPVSLFANTRIDTGVLVDWVIVGGESGRGARPMHPDWARGLRDECTSHDIPFLFKQWGVYEKVEICNARPGDVWVLGEGGTTPVPWRADTVGATAHRWGPHRDELMRRVGKHAAGRVLDRRTWDQFPADDGQP